jgi:hypothetical protein
MSHQSPAFGVCAKDLDDDDGNSEIENMVQSVQTHPMVEKLGENLAEEHERITVRNVLFE